MYFDCGIVTQMVIQLLKDRLCESLGYSRAAAKRPFNVVNVVPEKPKQQPVAEPVQAPASRQRSRTSSATYYQVWSYSIC